MSKETTSSSTSELINNTQGFESDTHLNEVRDSIRKNTKEYVVEKGDTLDKIARQSGVSFPDLIALNEFLGKPFKVRWRKGRANILIRPGDSFFIPKDVDLFKSNLKRITEILKVKSLNEKIANRDVKGLRETSENLFPGFVQSIGVQRMADGFIGAQKEEMDPRLPRIVDVRSQRNVSCANLIRLFQAQNLNIGDLSPEEKKYFQKQNVHAWILPSELMKIGFDQTNNLMSNFDTGKIGAIDPLNDEKRQEYHSGVSEMNEYLKKDGVKGTLLPLYFVYSRYKGTVAGYNAGRPDKHYNTHQSIFLGNIENWQFKASEVGNVVNGRVEYFGDNRHLIRQEIEKLNGDLAKTQSGVDKLKDEVLSSIDTDKNPTLFKKINHQLNRLVAIRSGKNPELAKKLMDVINTRDYDTIKAGVSKLIRRRMTDEDTKYALALVNSKYKAEQGLLSIQSQLNGTTNLNLEELNIENCGFIVKNNDDIQKAVDNYNKMVATIEKMKNEIKEKEGLLKKLDADEIKKEEDSKKAKGELERLGIQMKDAKIKFDEAKAKLGNVLTVDGNEKLKADYDRRYRKIFDDIGTTDEIERQRILDALRNNDTNYLSKYRALRNTEEINYRRSLYGNILKSESVIGDIRQAIGIEDGTLKLIETSKLGRIVSDNKELLAQIEAYNKEASRLNGLKREIDLNERLLRKELVNVSVPEYIANFIQTRADIGSSYNINTRKKIFEGLEFYPDLVDIKVDGVKIDIRNEMKLFKEGKKGIRINPNSVIELNGPMFLDGEHQPTSKDEDRKNNMNARTRMFFEFVVSQLYLPTELLVPGKNSSFTKNEFGRISDKFKIVSVYDIRNGERIEDILKRKIIAHEKLDEKAPDFERKLQEHYALQIKALQVSGFMQNESEINPGAFKINRQIPYFDYRDISKVFRDYIDEKKRIVLDTKKDTSQLREFVSIMTYPGDTRFNLFDSIKKDVLLSHKDKIKKYPNLSYIGELNEIQQIEFLMKFLKISLKEGEKFDLEKFIANIKPQEVFALSLKEIDKILGDIKNKKEIPSISVSENNVILTSFVTKNPVVARLIGNVGKIESGDPKERGFFSRSNLKEMASTFIDINSFGDFQLRVGRLKEGWIEWAQKSAFEEFFKIVESREFRDYISNSGIGKSLTVQKDYIMVSEMKKLILGKENYTQEDFKKIYNYVTKLLRLDDGSHENSIGKVLGMILLRNKLYSHVEKLNGQLLSCGIDIFSLTGDKEMMEDYYKGIIYINNVGENNALYAFSENYVLRLLESLGLNIETQDVYSTSIRGRIKGSLDYNRKVFIEDLQKYVSQVNPDSLGNEQKIIFNKIKELVSTLGKGIGTKQALYAFMKDPEILKHLKSKGLRTNYIPTENELRKGNFQTSVFNYLNKVLVAQNKDSLENPPRIKRGQKIDIAGLTEKDDNIENI